MRDKILEGLGWLVVILTFMALIAIAIVLCGCASTIETVKGDARTTTKVGFGNKIKLDTCEIEPSPLVVSAGERVGMAVVNKANEHFFTKVVDSVSSGTR